MEHPKRLNLVMSLLVAAGWTVLVGSSVVSADDNDTAGLGDRLGRRPALLWPPSSPDVLRRPTHGRVILGDWEYQAIPSGEARDGVPWRLIVTPAGPDAGQWRKGPLRNLSTRRVVGDHMYVKKPDKNRGEDTIPIIELPDVAWTKYMEADLQEAVGIHFHEYVTDDVARILYTLHKVPADDAEGKEPEDYAGKHGVRVEATLLAPITFHLDQSVVIRVDPLRQELTKSRTDHEFGHAEVSQRVFPAVLAGPQDWNIEVCTGRRSEMAYYWKRDLIGRSWSGYKNSVGQLVTLRTTIVLTPPTRWSLLLPIPPERVTQKTLQRFNDALVRLGSTFHQADQLAQD